MKAAAPPSASDTGLLARWLADLHRRPEALAWLQSLAPSLRAGGPVLDLIAQLAAEERDDATLKAALAAGAWGSWPSEAWTRAIAYRRQTDQPPPGSPLATWANVIAACGESLEGLRNLGRLASAWQRPKDAEAAWMAIIDREPNLLWAYQALQSSYRARQDSPSLLNLYNRWVQQYPLDDAAAEQWLMLAAVLDHATAAVTARAAALVQTDSPAILAKAAVFWRRGRPREAEKLLMTLTDQERQSPDGSFWMALTESDLNNPGAAAGALKLALGYPRSPEEMALLQAAAKKVRYQPKA
jgi:tetratricopeptide (TPR) repeat protein